MTNDEIRTIKSNRALLVCGNHPPIMTKLKPYYKNSLYRKYSALPAQEIKSEIHENGIPVLPLTVSKAKSDA